MRLWTLHPRYLDARGLVALWREALLAHKVLQGSTRGYKHHPQLDRFRDAPDPQAAIAAYLAGVLEEAERRGYAFDGRKIARKSFCEEIEEAEGQLLYEWRHLKRKLHRRDRKCLEICRSTRIPDPHPLFRIVPGDVRTWERVK